MKMVIGGVEDGGRCYQLQGENGHNSCWFASSGNADTLCSRVYPNETCLMSYAHGNGSCEGCTLN